LRSVDGGGPGWAATTKTSHRFTTFGWLKTVGATMSAFHPLPTWARYATTGIMIDPCCPMMSSVACECDAEASDRDLAFAVIEIHRKAGAALLINGTGADLLIQYCPWCGSRVGKDARELKDFER
jgi:hypothetical protein